MRIYIDYISFLVACSVKQLVNIDDFLEHIVNQIRQFYPVDGVIAMADWERMGNQERFQKKGIECVMTKGVTSTSIWYEMQGKIASDMQINPDILGVILVAGDINYEPVIEQVIATNRAIYIWTPTSLRPNTRAMINGWESILPPKTDSQLSWPRKAFLAMIVLLVDDVHQRGEEYILFDALVERLTLFQRVGQGALAWVNIAISEGLLFLQNHPRETRVQLNRQHKLVRDVFHIRHRIIAVMYAMLGETGWVAFTALEQSLSSSKLLFGKRHYRRAWLEMMVETGILQSEKRQKPGGQFITTVLIPNTNHPMIVRHEMQQHLRLVQLIIVVDNFLIRRRYSWMSVSTLLTYLTRIMTRIEARESLANAQEHSIFRLDNVVSLRDSRYRVTTLTLNMRHPMVAETLARRDEIIAFIASLIQERYLGIDRILIEKELMDLCNLSYDEISVWINLLISEAILIENTIPSSRGSGITSLSVTTDPIVNMVLG